MTYANITEFEKNELVKQYEPLIAKLVNQFFSKGATTWDQLKSMAYEGFALAINNYDDERSKMSFTQYAAFSIRNNILNGLNNELRTVKLSAYAQQKCKEWYGEESKAATFNTTSLSAIERNIYDDSSHGRDMHSREYKLGVYTNALFADGDVYEYLYSRIESQFPESTYNLFYHTFGLKDFEEMKGVDLAKKYKTSPTTISIKVNKVVKWIREDNELCEMLNNLVG